MTERILGWLGETSWQVAVLVLLILAVQALFANRLSPRWRYALWLLVVVRILLPIQPRVPAGVWRDDLRPTTWTAVREPGTEMHLGRMQASVEGPLREAPAPEVATKSVDERTSAPRSDEATTAPSVGGAPPGAGEPAAPSEGWLSSGHTLLMLYLGGLFFALVRTATSEVLFRRRLSRATRITDGRAQHLLQEGRVALRVRRGVELLETDAVSSPAIIGLRRPRLLLPAMTSSLGDEELRLVILHELSHVRNGDVALNALLALVRCIYWFHPLVHLAVHRVQAAQESVRDWEALASNRTTSPRSYANTLIKLLERAPERDVSPALGFLSSRRQLKRRILMIARFDSAPRGRLLGSALLLALGWIAFTSAAPSSLTVVEPVDEDQELRSLIVERHQELAPWKAEIKEQLKQPVTVGIDEASLKQVLDLLRTTTGVNFVAPQDVLDDYEEDIFTLYVQEKPLEQVLAILCRMANDGELGYTLYREAVYVGWADGLPQAFELRFYNVDELLSETSGEMSGPDTLNDMIREFVGPPESWDECEEASIASWKELFVISQTERGHEEIEWFLERLLNGGQSGPEEAPAWRRELEAALESSVDVEFRNTELGEVVDYLSQIVGVPVVVDRDRRDDRISLQLGELPLRTVLEWVADLTDLNVRLTDGAIVLDWVPEFTIEMYPVADLIGRSEEDLGYDELDALVHDSVARDSWEGWDEPRYAYWGDLLVVTQTPEVHARLGTFLDALRRASR